MTTFVNIGTLAQQLGLTHRTLRFWEQRGLVKSGRARVHGQRLYSEAQAARVEEIKRYVEFGFTLEEIRQLLDAPLPVVHERLQEQLQRLRTERTNLDETIARLTALLGVVT